MFTSLDSPVHPSRLERCKKACEENDLFQLVGECFIGFLTTKILRPQTYQ